MKHSLMRRLSLLVLLIGLSDCTGLGEFVDHTFTNPAQSPNLLIADSENVQRIRGLDPKIEVIEMEPGNIWPEFDERDASLRNVGERSERRNEQGVQPIRILEARSDLGTAGQPLPLRGKPAPQGQSRPGVEPPLGLVPPLSTASASHSTLPGPTAIVVPNGNGTSTVINPDGNIQTITTRR